MQMLFERSGLLQMIIQRNRPLANDNLEGPAVEKGDNIKEVAKAIGKGIKIIWQNS